MHRRQLSSNACGPARCRCSRSTRVSGRATVGHLPEGDVKRVAVNRYQRDQHARDACLQRWGNSCTVYGMYFGDRYGPMWARGSFHVHHLRPLSAGHAAVETTRGGSGQRPETRVPECDSILCIAPQPPTQAGQLEATDQGAEKPTVHMNRRSRHRSPSFECRQPEHTG